MLIRAAPRPPCLEEFPNKEEFPKEALWTRKKPEGFEIWKAIAFTISKSRRSVDSIISPMGFKSCLFDLRSSMRSSMRSKSRCIKKVTQEQGTHEHKYEKDEHEKDLKKAPKTKNVSSNIQEGRFDAETEKFMSCTSSLQRKKLKLISDLENASSSTTSASDPGLICELRSLEDVNKGIVIYYVPRWTRWAVGFYDFEWRRFVPDELVWGDAYSTYNEVLRLVETRWARYRKIGFIFTCHHPEIAVSRRHNDMFLALKSWLQKVYRLSLCYACCKVLNREQHRRHSCSTRCDEIISREDQEEHRIIRDNPGQIVTRDQSARTRLTTNDNGLGRLDASELSELSELSDIPDLIDPKAPPV